MDEKPLEVCCSEVKTLLDSASEDFLLIDCREAEEHALVAITGAKLLPMSELPARVSELDSHRERPIVVHCHHGMRSAQVASWLRERGFASVQSMAGGIDRWSIEIDPALPRY